MLYPLTFQPIFKERLWGSRALEELFRKPLPANLPIGESWEISDRPGDISVVDTGPLAGKTLQDLIQDCQSELLGSAAPLHGRFPLLAKILDAQEKLSLQVHPPPTVAQSTGEPKTEMWYIAEAKPGAELYAGLRQGVTREEFTNRLETGTVAECFHRLPVRAGDAMFVPSGRVHAIGAGCVIYEIQQNSDTTYRVFDWNRVDRDGKPRALHIQESLQAIDFQDFEPDLIRSQFSGTAQVAVRPLVACPWFEVEVWRLSPGTQADLPKGTLILATVRGQVQVDHPAHPASLPAGRFCLRPATLEHTPVRTREGSEFLVVRVK